MATLLLTTVGTLVAGPVGGALGALAGNQIDSAIFGRGSGREGPRLKELAVTSSSYGQAIARHFGAVRVPGILIWSTDLIETRRTSGGGKGKPKTTSYSYSASFAVALGSRPIQSIGRIWADGNLLRGAAGDLKTGGLMRLYPGTADQQVDPLIAAAQGGDCPAFRDCAYVVFEDLQLGDFGNRIPSLTFEIFADAENQVSLSELVPGASIQADNQVLPHLLGFSDDGGSVRSAIGAINAVLPLSVVTGSTSLEISLDSTTSIPTTLLPEELAIEEGGAGGRRKRRRSSDDRPEPRALRYYDFERDYQPGLQRAVGKACNGREAVVEIPATIVSDGARSLANAKAQRESWQREQIEWKIFELDTGLRPGMAVAIPGMPGIWRISSWEWTEQGIGLELERAPPANSIDIAGSSGAVYPPPDLLPWPTVLRAFELPWDGASDPNQPSLFAVGTAGGTNWSGAELYVEQSGTLASLDSRLDNRAVIGSLGMPLAPSNATLFEAFASLEVDLVFADQGFSSTSIAGLASGANRLLVGAEVIQFVRAVQLTETKWHLSGLLRGRGGTEHFATDGHATGTQVVLLDDSLVSLDATLVPAMSTTRIAALGFGDEEPAYADLQADGSSRRPLSPVHGRVAITPAGDWNLLWTRRARGQWQWEDLAEIPLVEEVESYLVGVGTLAQPSASWIVGKPELLLDAATIASLQSSLPESQIWVRQIGTYGQSAATLIASLPS